MSRKNDGIWKNAARNLTAALIILVLAASLMPVLTPPANAQDCPVGQVLDATGSCVPELVDEDVNSDTGQGGEEAPDPGNQEDVTPTPEGGEELPPAADPPEADPAEEDDPANLLPVTPEPVGDGYVTVHKYDCGAIPDMAIKTLEELRGSCAPAAGVVFGATNLDAGDVVLTSEEFGTDASGFAAFTVPNPYTVIINEVIPGGYGDPLAFCGYPTNNQDNALYQYFPAGGALYFSLAAGEQLYCDWFNAVPVDPASEAVIGALSIAKYECDQSPGVNIGSPLPDLGSYGCVPMDNVAFTVSGGAVDLVADTGNDGPGLVIFTGFGAGLLTVTENVPQGYGEPVVYCANSIDDPMGNILTQVATQQASVALQRNAGESSSCAWLNVPADTGDETDAVADIIVHKYECDQDPAPSSETEIDSAFQQAGCSLMNGVDFTVEGQGTNFSDTRTTGDDETGTAQWLGLNTAPAYSIIETVPAGYDTPIPYCVREIGSTIVFSHAGPSVSIGFLLGEEDERIKCYWANVPVEEGDGDITIYKYECSVTGPPVLLGRDGIDSALQKAGCTTMDGVEFTLSELNGPVLDVKLTGSDDSGTIFWNLAAPNGYTVTETVPDGFATPVKYCWVTDEADTTPYNAPAEGASIDLEVATGDHYECWWINIPDQGDGSIHINKFTCPEGYDPYAQGIDPFVDCPVVTNGIEFLLNDADAQVTGQVFDGAVNWTGLSAGTYYVDETEPAGTAAIFIWDCQGNDTPMIQGSPISSGPFLLIELMPGDHIVCNWFNVPEAPDTGTVTVVKYGCGTAVFVSVDDCQIYEGGADFELSVAGTYEWTTASSGTTNGSGVLSFTGLAEGTYQIDETGGEWCHAVADYTDQNGYLVVTAGQETTVRVYNCNVTVTKQPPTKYPNTGVGQPEASEVAPAAPVLPEDGPEVLDPGTWMGVMDWRLIAPFSASDKPVQIAIESIGLSAEIETLEIVDGAFQDPTTSDQVAWYKDTAKLGEDGNIVMAGHLNYWGDPEGVFYSLNQVKEGDEIVVTAEDGTVYRYEVIAVSQQVANSRTLRAITQPTDEPTLTLITCGGAWDPSIQSYLHRTVVRAELIEEDV